jgi:GT2 family glycosyltransferase
MGRVGGHTVRASIVIVNKDDQGVERTLEALEGLPDEGFEVVVVDASAGRLDHIRRRFPDSIWIDYEHPNRKPRTIAEQRNVGVRSATGEVVVFLDANCVPDAEWLSSLLRPIDGGAESIVVGAVNSRGSRTVHDRVYNVPAYLSECSTMNLAVKRSVFEQVGTFDESLGFAEDVDFAWRAVAADFRLFYAPDAVVTHDWGSPSQNVERAFRYGVARMRLYRKHPEQLRRLAGPDFSVAAYTLYVAFLPVAFFVPAYLLVLAVPLWRNRRRRPLVMVAYQLCYGLGVLSELLHVPVLAGQRRHDALPG